jgi:hypothetical protein
LTSALSSQQAQGTRALGPYTCGSTSSFPNVNLTGVNLTQTNSLSIDFRYDSESGGLQRLVARGDVKIEIKSSLIFAAAYEGKLTCQGEIFQFTIPIGGPLALIFGGHVPIGAGIEFAGKITVAQAGVEAKASTQHTVQIGIDCSGGASCAMVNSYTDNHTAEIKPIIPDPGSQFRLEYSLFAYGFIDLALGNRFISFLRFQAFTIKGGLKQSFNFAPMNVQMNDPAYASDFKLALEVSAGTGRAINSLLNLLQINLVKLEFKRTIELARSPTGTLDITTGHNHSSPTHVRPAGSGNPGDEAEFVVNLDRLTYLGVDVVDGVTIRRKDENNEAVEIDGSCEQIDGSGTSFSCLAAFDEDVSGSNSIYAFIDLELFGVSLPVVLEVNLNSKAELDVDPEPVITDLVNALPSQIIADVENDVKFTIPFRDLGENVVRIHGSFELPGNATVFDLSWNHDEAFVSGFTDEDEGIGSIELVIVVLCSEQGNRVVKTTWRLEDAFGHESPPRMRELNVSYTGCPTLQEPATIDGGSTVRPSYR